MNENKKFGILLINSSILVFTINIMLAQISMHLDRIDREYSPSILKHIPISMCFGVSFVFLFGIYLYFSKNNTKK